MRPPWVGLRHMDRKIEAPVLGRRFCPKCGKWRLLADFGPNKGRKFGFRVYCYACDRAHKREEMERLTPEEKERRLAIKRQQYAAKRIAAGFEYTAAEDRPPKYTREERLAIRRERERSNRAKAGRPMGPSPKSITSIVLKREYAMLDSAPLIAELLKRNGQLVDVAAKAGLDDRQIRRTMSGESARVSVAIADRLCIAMDIHLEDLYDYQPGEGLHGSADNESDG